MNELGNECAGGVLIAKSISPRLSDLPGNVLFLSYGFDDMSRNELYTYDELLERLTLTSP